MKIFSVPTLLVALILPAWATDQPPAKIKAAPAAKIAKAKSGTPAASASSAAASTSATPTPATPAPAQAPMPAPAGTSGALTLDAYMDVLTDQLSLSKDEQTDIKTYYLADGAKLQGILNNGSLSPLQQTAQVDALRDTRNGTIEALLGDVGRQHIFLMVEAGYRVALVELAASGALVPATPPPTVPKPTSTTPAEATPSPKA